MSRAVIFVNGSIPDLESARRLLRADDMLIGVDGGTRHALALGLVPSVVIGDMDSIPGEDLQRLDPVLTRIIRFPHDKDETDLELALHHALEAGVDEVVLMGAFGGRLDQMVANLALLTDPTLRGVDIRCEDGLENAFFTCDQCRVDGDPGDIISLIPWGVEAAGVTTSGLRWPLKDETLFPSNTRGISNELVEASATIQIRSGLLLVIQRRQGSK